jgi:hypothetical protein
MAATDLAHDLSHALGGERLIMPGETDTNAERLTLPLPNEPGSTGQPPEEVRKAWIEYMVSGFQHNEEMFKRTLEAFMKPYYLTMWMYGALFALGAVLIVVAAVVGLRDGQPVVAIVFGGMGVGTFVLFFIRQPVQALEENLEFINWMGVAFNTYWTRLMYMMDTRTVQHDLKAADDDYSNTVERIITKHAELRGKRPGGDLGSNGGRTATPS